MRSYTAAPAGRWQSILGMEHGILLPHPPGGSVSADLPFPNEDGADGDAPFGTADAPILDRRCHEPAVDIPAEDADRRAFNDDPRGSDADEFFVVGTPAGVDDREEDEVESTGALAPLRGTGRDHDRVAGSDGNRPVADVDRALAREDVVDLGRLPETVRARALPWADDRMGDAAPQRDRWIVPRVQQLAEERRVEHAVVRAGFRIPDVRSGHVADSPVPGYDCPTA